MVSKKAKALLVKIFAAKQVARHAEDCLLSLLAEIEDKIQRDVTVIRTVRQLREQVLANIKEKEQKKRKAAKNQPKKPPRVKKYKPVRVIVECWNQHLADRGPDKLRYTVTVKAGKHFLQQIPVRGRYRGLFTWSEAVAFANDLAEAFGASVVLPEEVPNPAADQPIGTA